MSRSDTAASCDAVVMIYPAASGPVHALKEVDAEVVSGTITAFVGPSGSGKSTLLRLLAAIDTPTAGEVWVAGRATRSLSPSALRRLRRNQVAFVSQRPSHDLLDHLNSRQHLQHAARLAGRRRAPIEHLLTRFGLADRAEATPAMLSGGEQQRLAVAMGVVRQPAVLIADEPTAELDDRSAGALLDVLATVRDLGQAVAVSTHDPRVVAAADRVYSLRHGSIHQHAVSGRTRAVIDGSGRVQLPPAALDRFPDRRAVLRLVEDGSVVLEQP